MKKLIKSFIASCGLCFGMGHQELPNGDTRLCPKCKGKGLI